MTRRKINESAREKIFREAEQLILTQGFNGTSLDSVCAAAGITKGAFFHHFASKEDLASQILRKYWLQTVSELAASKYMKSKSPLSRLLGTISFFEDLFEIPKRPTACLIGNITQEVALTSPSVRATCESIFLEWADALRSNIEEVWMSQKRTKKLDSRGLAEMIIATVEGAFILVKATNDLRASKRTMSHLKNYLRLTLS